MENKYNCRFCGKEFSSQNALASHTGKCINNPFKDKSRISNKEYTFNCIKCGKEFKKAMSEYSYSMLNLINKLPKCCSTKCANSHIISEETKEKISKGVKKFNSKKYSLTPIKQTLKCKYCGKEFTYIKSESFSKLYCSVECKHNFLSEHTGGYRKGSGHGKSGWYKGIYCDSSWELAFVIYHLDNSLKIKRCKEKRNYFINNKEHIYIPDFVTDEGIIEIKGYKNDIWIEKEKQNPDIKVLYKEDMKFYIDYVIKKYGNDYIKLYDNLNPNIKNISNKNISWFYKVNDKNKTYVNAFITDKEDFDYYINNDWNIGRVPINVFIDYKNVRCKSEIKILRKIKKEDKEKYLSSLL